MILIFILYNIANYAIHPFLYTYQTKELGFNLQLIAMLGIFGNLARILISRFWGRYADRTSFANMMEKCLLVMALAFFSITAATPATGIVAIALYHIFHGIAMGGVNSALLNLVFDYVPVESRSDSLAICQAIAGVVGFLTTLAISPILSVIQANGLELFSMTIYAQQLLALFSALVVIGTALFVRVVILKKTKRQSENNQ